MNPLAERYVKLVLAMGPHDADYVDAYYGPPEWRKEAESSKRTLAAIDSDATALAAALAKTPPDTSADELIRLRHSYLTRQLDALRARVAMLQGRKLTFDEESKALYDAVAPRNDAASFEQVLAELSKKLPGFGAASRAIRCVPQPLRDPARSPGCDLQGGDRRMPAANARARHAAAGRELHRRVRHEQELERLQLVSGPVQEPDSGEHRSADLRGPRDRPRLPRRLSGPPRLQRAAREEPRARSRLGRVLGLPALLAAVAHRGRDGELRHRRGVPESGAHRVRTTHDLSRPPASIRPAPGTTTRSSRSSIASRTPATRRRACTSTARSTPQARLAGSSDTRSTRRRGRRSACGSSTSTAATSSTTTWARTW